MRNNPATVSIHAKTLNKALAEAANQLGVDQSDVGYRVISQTDGGILSFLGAKKVEISAWSEGTPRRNASPRSRERSHTDSAPKPELSGSEVDELVEDLRQFCAGICKYLAGGDEVDVEASLEGERLVLNIDNDDLTQQISKNSKIAESMEHILRKKPRHLKRELPFRIFIDVRGLRLQREHELIDMAEDLSLKVHENQKPIVLNYKSSYDRKIIHMALDKDNRVYTKSIGTGANRKLMILPVRQDEAPEA